jgi:DNA invertase Pin-like site-specific DNA recombinase
MRSNRREPASAGEIDCVVTHRVDRLSRSLLDFAKLMEAFEQHHVAFVSVTQHFNSATSMGRLVLNVLLSFAQFERELIAERTRDKMAAARRKGKWSGGVPILGYDVDARTSRCPPRWGWQLRRPSLPKRRQPSPVSLCHEARTKRFAAIVGTPSDDFTTWLNEMKKPAFARYSSTVTASRGLRCLLPLP